MLNLIFGLSWVYDILLSVGILVLLFICLKFKGIRIFIFTAVGICYIALTAWSTTQLQAYYSASGGIYGKLTGLFKPNDVAVESSENVKFDFKNMMLTATENEDEYEAEIVSEQIIKLSADEFYMVYINSTPCTFVENSQDYVIARYSYNFYDREFNLLCSDTLTFRFAFYTNSCKLIVTTNGGATAVRYWQEYFNYNTFIVEICKADFDVIADALDGYSLVQFKVDEDIVSKQLIKNGGHAIAPANPVVENKQFNYWQVDGVQVDIANFDINSDCVFDAHFTNIYTLRIINPVTDEDVVVESVLDGEEYVFEDYTFEDEHYIFRDYSETPNWATNKKNAGDSIVISGDTTYYVRYTSYCRIRFYDGATLLKTLWGHSGDQFDIDYDAPSDDLTITGWVDANGDEIFDDYYNKDIDCYAVRNQNDLFTLTITDGDQINVSQLVARNYYRITDLLAVADVDVSDVFRVLIGDELFQNEQYLGSAHAEDISGRLDTNLYIEDNTSIEIFYTSDKNKSRVAEAFYDVFINGFQIDDMGCDESYIDEYTIVEDPENRYGCGYYPSHTGKNLSDYDIVSFNDIVSGEGIEWSRSGQQFYYNIDDYSTHFAFLINVTLKDKSTDEIVTRWITFTFDVDWLDGYEGQWYWEMDLDSHILDWRTNSYNKNRYYKFEDIHDDYDWFHCFEFNYSQMEELLDTLIYENQYGSYSGVSVRILTNETLNDAVIWFA